MNFKEFFTYKDRKEAAIHGAMAIGVLLISSILILTYIGAHIFPALIYLGAFLYAALTLGAIVSFVQASYYLHKTKVK